MTGGAGDVDDAAVGDVDLEAAARRAVVGTHGVHERILDYDDRGVRAH
jgi:hypothetical protein